MIKLILRITLALLLFTGCEKSKDPKKNNGTMEQTKTISESAQKVRDYMKKNVIIAHRGSTYWTPEETQPAFLWARNIGADYLEFDVQLTKDKQLIAFHDKNLSRTTNVADIFPERAKSEISSFTLKELRRLDAGSWFNTKNPNRAKNDFKGLKIMTLKDVIMIAEGYRIATKNGQAVKDMKDGQWTGQYQYEKDPNDNGNRPGIYVETKNPKPGTEKILTDEITAYGWNINTNPKTIKTTQGKVDVANTNARFVLQSFSLESLKQLEKQLPNIPKCLLLWQPNMKDDLKGNYEKAIDFCIKTNVHSMGTSIAGAPNNYKELTAPWMAKRIHDAGMVIHPYTFDTKKQLTEYKDRVEGVFTNRADLALEFYGRKSTNTPQEILIELGYK
jgi:glycerophosphoryl diester phosphodiesterase